MYRKRFNQVREREMDKAIQTYIEFREKRLEALIRGGLLKRKNAYDILCGFADTVRHGTSYLKNKSLFDNITPMGMLILTIGAYLALS